MKLVKTITVDNLILSGLFFEGRKDKPVVIFIHGFEGDFFSHKWISLLGENLYQIGMGFLSVQNRGTAIRQELITTEGEAFYTGSHYEKLEDSYKDIDAWIQYLLNNGYENVILVGHSLGTIKITKYLFEGVNKKVVKKIILLAPFDKNWLLKNAAKMVNITLEELIHQASLKVQEGKGDEIAPYGFDDVPHSYQNFLSWADQSEKGRMFDFHDSNYQFPLLQKIDIPVKIIVGDNDEFFHPSKPNNPDEAMTKMLHAIKNSQGQIIKGSGHSFRGYEEELVQGILSFLQL